MVKSFRIVLLMTLMIMTLNGCQSKPSLVKDPDPAKQPSSPVNTVNTSISSEDLPEPAIPDMSGTSTDLNPSSDPVLPSNEKPSGQDVTTQTNTETEPKEDSVQNDASVHIQPDDSQVDSHPPLNTALRLMGFAIGETQSRIEGKFGAPADHYMIQDEFGTITVYEYTGFTVGFDVHNRIEFIDVTSSGVDPGLSGLKVGDNLDSAISALGEPETKTAYVLNYQRGGHVLKLDIDPQSNTIQSIKLFAD